MTEMMREVGLEVHTDPAGNIIGHLAGRKPLPPLAFGSHVDTVRNGGRFDGILGVMAGIECISALRQAGHTTEHPIEVIVFANEEGQTFGALCGSRAIAGLLKTLIFLIPTAPAAPWRTRFATSEEILLDSRRQRVTEEILRRFIELHIEQGGVLESAGIPIGIVEGISGICLH